MKNKIIYLIFIIAIYINNVYSQTYYYGKNKIGQMIFLDDSLCLVSFINYVPDKPIIDTCFYKKYDNEIVLNSKYKHKFDITPMDTTIIIDNSVPMIFKSYFNISLNDYYIDQEFIVDLDTINNQFIIKNDSRYLHLNTIFIISYKNKYYKMFFYLYPMHGEKYYLVKYHQNIMNHSLYFDNFSFIIKGNRLIPYYYFSKDIFINDNEFYLENGFYIPVMKFSKRGKNYKGYCKDDLILSGIPESLCKPRKTKYYKINVKKSRKNYHINKTTVIT